jgi:PfaB family protein
MKEKIAIIGMSALFPGSATLDGFWQNLMEKKDLTSLANANDFGVDPARYFNDKKGVVDRCYSLRGGFIRDFQFNPNGYKLPPAQLKNADVLYQWALHVSKEALIHARYDKKIDNTCGVILGNLSFPTGSTHRLLSQIYTDTLEKAINQGLNDQKISIASAKLPIPDNDPLQGDAAQFVKTALGLQGTAFDLDAACASSLYAIKLACDELLAHKSDLMLAGAVCGSDQFFIHMGFSMFHAYARTGDKFVPFDKNSGGLVSSEGAGMVVLKRLKDAERDGDTIFGIIAGVGLSNDGKGKFLLSPNPKGQITAFERAYQASGANPADTTYIECHATGTPLGDITEFNSIETYFSQFEKKPLLGSVKSNMGHLLTAAGMTGLFKVLLAMEKQVIPPNINMENPIQSEKNWLTGEQIIIHPTKWEGKNKQAGINSFGFGGTNAHIVIIDNGQLTIDNGNPIDNVQLTIDNGNPIDNGQLTIDNGNPIDNGQLTIDNGNPIDNGQLTIDNENKMSIINCQLSIVNCQLSITGMDVHFGTCEGIDNFYDTIYNGTQHFRELPKNRWKGFEENRELLAKYGLHDIPKGNYIENFEIDLLRYKIQPKEAETLEPQQALILKVADKAIQDAQLKEGQNVAVIIAMSPELAIHHYLARWDAEWQLNDALKNRDIDDKNELIAKCKNLLYERDGEQTPSQHTSFVGNIMASRIAALWDFTGPAFTVTNGDDSVLRAIEIAQNMLTNGEVEAVVVGGVDFSGGLEHVLLNANSRKNQYIGEGAGAIVLQKSTNISPNATIYAQIDAIGKQLHGENIASVAANIGHTFAASGIAELIKTAICLHHQFLPYHVENGIHSAPWIKKNNHTTRQAVVNSTSDTKILLLENPKTTHRTATWRNKNTLFFLKGNSEISLLQQLNALEIALETPFSFAEIAYQFYIKAKNSEYDLCISLLAASKKALNQEIKFLKILLPNAFSQQIAVQTPQGSYFNPRPTQKTGKLAFVYPGSATAYQGLGAEVFQLFPDVLRHYEGKIDGLDQFIWSEYLYPREQVAPPIQRNAIAMMSVGVFFSSVYTHILREYFKIEPHAALGYSMGECSSMYYSLGIWQPDEAEIFQKSPIFKDRFAGNLELLQETWGISREAAQNEWVSVVLLTSKEKVLPLIYHQEKVYLTFINTDNEVIISGNRTLCYEIAQKIGCMTFEVPFQNVIHHDFCKREEQGLLEMHHFPIQEQPNIDFYSSMKMGKIELESTALARNSTDVCYQKVDFPTLIRTVFKENINTFIEVGANSTCTNWIKDILKNENHAAVSFDKKGISLAQSMLATVGQVVSNGFSAEIGWIYAAPNPQKQAKTFMKKIKTGGKRIFEEIPTIQFVETLHRNVSPLATPLLHEAQETLRCNVSTKINNMTITQNTTKIGENGLILQDFTDNQHLQGKKIIFSQQDLEEFAEGKIANVFGKDYAVIDTYKRRVMLPMHPYLLVSRVTGLNGKMGEFKPSTMQTEYDIPYNSWYATDGQIPWAVSVESGQCDLLLISYLGIDFQAKGDYVYRLLDCTLTFLDDLPYEGQTLRYDISINNFVRNGNNLLFFFSYECFVQDRIVLKMDGGCAGFFRDDQLADGAGVIYTASELENLKKIPKKTFTPLLKTKKTSFSKEDLRHLIKGDIHKCFDDISYFPNGRNPSLRLPDERILMMDSIVSVDTRGGAYGLGEIIAEKNLSPDDWFFPCHFRDDEVLAGSLQAEGGGNLLKFYMLMLGLQRFTKDARFQPVYNLPQKVRCRKQVTPTADTKLIYKLVIKEIGLTPHPYMIGDLEIISNGIITVHFENLGLQLREKSNPKYLNIKSIFTPSERSKGALMNEADISTFALGNLADCFGQEYAVYNHRETSRQPNTDLQFISRVLKVEGTRGDFSKPSTIFAEYDVPKDAWYYVQNASVAMPYSIMMEIALQPCGLVGAYLGSTLKFPDQDLYLRNLDGEGTYFDLPNGTDFRGKTILNKSVLLSSVALGGVTIQKYTYELSIDGKMIYKGASSFGFFTKAALASQVGLDNSKEVEPWYKVQNLTTKDYFQYKLDSLYGKMKLFKGEPTKPHFRLSGDQLTLIDGGLIVKNGGNFGKGYVYANKAVKTYDWFFTCHFYQDPVMPGSLGVEAIFQAIQTYCIQQKLGASFKNPRFQQLENHKTNWKYRGQILLHVKEMQLEVHIKSIEIIDNQLIVKAEAFLWNEKIRIYHITNIALAIEES